VSSPTTTATVQGGWLGGPGAADCKTAVAIFSHIGVGIAARAEELAGSLTLLFDADEHTGRFGAVRSYVASAAPPDGVMIGYPGLDEILVGARWFWRARLQVSGQSGHSGSRPALPSPSVRRSP